MKIFTNHRAALATGIILALLVAVLLHMALSDPQAGYVFNVQSFGRWLHIGAGIFWIGWCVSVVGGMFFLESPGRRRRVVCSGIEEI